MISEQVWDAPDIADKELYFGRPSGSAMPLVWAHAAYVKLSRSLRDGRMFDTPPQTVQRYQVKKTGSPNTIWRFNHKCRTVMRGKMLRLEVLAARQCTGATTDGVQYMIPRRRARVSGSIMLTWRRYIFLSTGHWNLHSFGCSRKMGKQEFYRYRIVSMIRRSNKRRD